MDVILLFLLLCKPIKRSERERKRKRKWWSIWNLYVFTSKSGKVNAYNILNEFQLNNIVFMAIYYPSSYSSKESKRSSCVYISYFLFVLFLWILDHSVCIKFKLILIFLSTLTFKLKIKEEKKMKQHAIIYLHFTHVVHCTITFIHIYRKYTFRIQLQTNRHTYRHTHTHTRWYT